MRGFLCIYFSRLRLCLWGGLFSSIKRVFLTVLRVLHTAIVFAVGVAARACICLFFFVLVMTRKELFFRVYCSICDMYVTVSVPGKQSDSCCGLLLYFVFINLSVVCVKS